MSQATNPTSRLIVTVAVYAGLCAGLVFAAFPVLWMLVSSVKTNTEIFSLPPRIIPKLPTGEAYAAILTDPTKVRFFLNSYLVASVVTVLTLLVATLSGYSFSRHTFRFKKTLNLFIIGTQTVPPITLMIPYFGLVVAFGLYNTYFALIFTYMVFTLPYAILMMTGYFNTLPRELDEADPLAPAYAVYEYLGWVLSQVVDALSADLPPPTADQSQSS